VSGDGTWDPGVSGVSLQQEQEWVDEKDDDRNVATRKIHKEVWINLTTNNSTANPETFHVYIAVLAVKAVSGI